MQIIPGKAGSGNAIHSIAPTGDGEAGSGVRVQHLLLVDDEADGAEFAAILLRSHGLRVTVVHSANEALKALESGMDVNYLLTDVIMPGVSGLQLADVIRDRYPTIKIIIMSGCVSSDALGEYRQAYLFTCKPYRIDTIIALLNC
jgi:DNA-binding NtrC family response regulator